MGLPSFAELTIVLITFYFKCPNQVTTPHNQAEEINLISRKGFLEKGQVSLIVPGKSGVT